MAKPISGPAFLLVSDKPCDHPNIPLRLEEWHMLCNPRIRHVRSDLDRINLR